MSRPSRFTVREQHGAEQIDTAQLKPETKPSKQKPMPRAFATALIVQSAPKKVDCLRLRHWRSHNLVLLFMSLTFHLKSQKFARDNGNELWLTELKAMPRFGRVQER